MLITKTVRWNPTGNHRHPCPECTALIKTSSVEQRTMGALMGKGPLYTEILVRGFLTAPQIDHTAHDAGISIHLDGDLTNLPPHPPSPLSPSPAPGSLIVGVLTSLNANFQKLDGAVAAVHQDPGEQGLRGPQAHPGHAHVRV